ncbi:hypothetical protein [Cupriavidus sp. D39]|uniref:hypothetical protein n=1 Tax=Cupriavidus sp. D39 TaxID=2997877 RepID=UPI00226DA72A|nr:hypothetical protein [Cupriavidus sp. D39]MCY0856867.1 hypothetical protein [Cupriavidus sp. D39]
MGCHARRFLPTPPLAQARQVAADAAVDEPAELLTRHRREWRAVRNLAYAAIKSKSLEALLRRR